MDSVVNDEYLQEEYRLLGQQTVPRPRTEAEYNRAHVSATLPCNKIKNRYTDVLPVESTRIKLAPRANEPGSDYINANTVTDPTPPTTGEEVNAYICSQAPLANTLNDFWRMVWEQVRISTRSLQRPTSRPKNLKTKLLGIKSLEHKVMQIFGSPSLVGLQMDYLSKEIILFNE